MNDTISYGLSAKLAKAFEEVGATPEIMNAVAEDKDSLRDLVQNTRFSIEEKRRIEIYDSFQVRAVAAFWRRSSLFKLATMYPALHLTPQFEGRLHSTIDSSFGGYLTSVRLLKTTRHRDIKNRLTPTTSFIHVFQFLKNLLDNDGNRGVGAEHHVFLASQQAGTVLIGEEYTEHWKIVPLGITVHIESEKVTVDAMAVSDDMFWRKDAILHSFVEDTEF